MHPITGRTQDIVFQGKRTDAWEKVIRARTIRAEQELAKPRRPDEPHIVYRGDIARTAHANDVYNDQILTGKVAPCPDIATTRYFFEKPMLSELRGR